MTAHQDDDATPFSEAASFWILESKLAQNRANVDLVARDRLLSVLDEALPRKLALVTAPAGFGKSTLLQQWADRVTVRGVAAATLTLDEEDTDQLQFLAYVALAIARSGVNLADVELGARQGFSESPTRAVLASLLRQLHRNATPCVLILDDYHRAESTDLNELLKSLLNNTPENFTLVVSSRTPPALEAPALIAAGAAVEIGPDQLRLTREETVAALGSSLAVADPELIFVQTEGWPVAVQLALAQKRAKPTASVDAAGARRLVAAYLTEQVLSSLDEDVQEFLLSVAPLERFNPDLANAVRMADDSWRLLDKLAPLTALIVPLDADGDWSRLHHLFAEYLREDLLKRDPQRLPMIYRRASGWNKAQGYLVEAVKYAAKAGDADACARIILEAGGWKIILTNSISQLRNMLRCLDPATIAAYPRLLLARAYLHCKDGEPSEARTLFEAAAATGAGDSDPLFEQDHTVMEALVNIYDDAWGPQIASVWSRQAGAAADHLDPINLGTIKCGQAVSHFAFGQLSEADDAIQAAFRHMRQGGSVLGLNYCYLHAATAALYAADLDLAKANIDRALELAEANFGSDSGLKHMANVLRFAVAVWSGEAGHEDMPAFAETLSYIEEHDGWTEMYFVGYDAAFQLARQCNDIPFADDIVARASHVADRRRLDRLARFATALRASAQHLAGDEADALYNREKLASWRTPASAVGWRHDWQTLTISACLPMRAGAPSEEDLAAFSEASAFTEQAGARFHGLRVAVARALALRAMGSDAEGQRAFASALHFAARHRLAGAFIGGADVKQALRAAREELRVNEKELITVNFVSAALARHEALSPSPHSDLLTGRERDILERLALGESNKQIALHLELTENTVKFHLKNIFAKLSVSRRAHAIIEARKLNLVE